MKGSTRCSGFRGDRIIPDFGGAVGSSAAYVYIKRPREYIQAGCRVMALVCPDCKKEHTIRAGLVNTLGKKGRKITCFECKKAQESGRQAEKDEINAAINNLNKRKAAMRG